MRLTALIIIAALLATSGCASITRGTSQGFGIQSNPTGATATVSTGQVCTTPCEIKVPRKFAITVLLELPGYKPITAKVDSERSAAGSRRMLGNMMFGGLMGAMIDLNSGALQDLTPNPLRVQLAPGDSTEESVVLGPEEPSLDAQGEATAIAATPP